MTHPSRGEIWLAHLDPKRGREQAGQRPVLIVSENLFNHGPADLVIICPLTSTMRQIPTHILIAPPEGGLRMPGVILCDAARTIAKARLSHRWGFVAPNTIARVDDCFRILLGI